MEEGSKHIAAPGQSDNQEIQTSEEDIESNTSKEGIIESDTTSESANSDEDITESANSHSEYDTESAKFDGTITLSANSDEGITESANSHSEYDTESAKFAGTLTLSANSDEGITESANSSNECITKSATIDKTIIVSANSGDGITESANSDEGITESATSYESIWDNTIYIKDHILNGYEAPSTAKQLINIADLLSNSKMSKTYEVNGSKFVDDDCLSSHDDDSLVRYELYKVEKTGDDDDEDYENEDLTTELDVHIQELPQGVIINSNVFLSDAHWNTMSWIDDKLFRCAVCQMYCDRTNRMDHMETEAHIRNLDTYKPLKRFDLSIVRKININLHCGVCNDIFDIIDYKTHENSKSHEGNLLTAINKVSDLMYDSNIHRDVYKERSFQNADRNVHVLNRNIDIPDRNIRTPDRNVQTPDGVYRNNNSEYHFDANAINNNNINVHMPDRNIQTPDRNIWTPDRNIWTPDRNVRTPDRNVRTPDGVYRNNNNEYHFNANAINNNNINVYEEFSGSDEEDEEYDYENEEYNTPCEGISYASMARKPRIELPKFLKIDLGDKEVRVKFESWHMIIRPEMNKFYCMVCNKQDHIRFKTQHCISCEHVEKLAMCTVVGAFEDYLIRTVNDKLYHCGHCNNLQYQNQMSDHIESAHPRKNKNIIDTVSSPLKTKKVNKINDRNDSNSFKNKSEKSETVKSETSEAVKSESEKCAILNKSIEYRIETKTAPVIDIFGDVTLAPFGCELQISALSLNIIMKREDEYYCAVCDVVCEDVKAHVEELTHMQMMNITPFIRPFKSNLTRAVRGTLHCGLCNKLVMTGDILEHNMGQPHTTALANAMGMKKNQRPQRNTNGTYFSTHSADLDKASAGLDKTGAVLDKSGAGLEKIKTAPQIAKPAVGTNNIRSRNDSQSSIIISDKNSNNKSPMISPNQLLKENKKNATQKLDTHKNGAQKKSGQNGNTITNPVQNQPVWPNNENGQNFYHGQNIYPGQNPNGQYEMFPPLYNPLDFPGLPKLDSQTINHILALNYSNFNTPGAPFPPYTHIPIPSNHQNVNQPNFNYTNFNNNQNKTDQKLSYDKTHKKTNINTSNKTQVKKNGVENNAPKSVNDTIKSVNDTIKSVNDTIKSATKKSNDTIKSVKHTVKTVDNCFESGQDTENQSDEELKEFDEEEFVYLKLKNAFFKITNLSYHTLVYLENGVRHCFVCSNSVSMSILRKHVDSREHAENVNKNKFLDKYGSQLFRQMYFMYHCAICNVLMTRKEIKLHLDWPTHIETYNLAHKILNKKNRKELKSGIKEYVVEMQKEAIYLSVQSKINVVAAYQIVSNLNFKKDSPESKPANKSKTAAVKKNKMLIMNNLVMKISFDHWHGITSSKNVTKCIICQIEIKSDEIFEHVETEYHGVALGKTFEKNYYPALVRKINENTVNCMICNLELLNNEGMVHEHVNGRKHNKNQDSIVNESTNSDSYGDCYEDYLNL